MSTQDSTIKLSVQKRIVTVSILILVAKFAAYLLTNSVGILTDALESIVNVVTGLVTVYSISVAIKPHDKNHPFGHGKVESLSASLEGILILMAGLVIIYEAIKRIFSPVMPEELGVGIVIVAVGGILNYLLGMYSVNVGKKHNSIALVAGGKHLQSDTYSTIGLVIGLLLLWWTNIAWLDSAIAIVFGGIIIYTGFKILKETTSNLMDEADFEMVKEISDIMWNNKTENWIEVHNLRLVKYGDSHHVDCDLVVPWFLNVREGHHESDHLRDVVKKQYSENMDFTVHLDACKPIFCDMCRKPECAHRTEEYTKTDSWTVDEVTQKRAKLKQLAENA